MGVTPRVEFRKSPAKAFGLLLGAIALVAAAVFVARRGDDAFIRGVAWFGVVFFGLGLVKAAMDLFSKDVAYVFDERGIEDRVSGIGLIPWTAIREVQVMSFRGTRVLLLSLDRPDDYLNRVSPMKRHLAGFNRSAGWGDWALTFVGLTPCFDEAERLVRERYATGTAG